MKSDAPDTLEATTKLLKALADPVRLRLVNLLLDGREVCVCHLHEALALPQPTVSRHLAYLRKHGIVSGRKEGLWVYYKLARATSSLHRGLLDCLNATLPDMQQLRSDQQRLNRTWPCCD
ncbi:MAG TPA: metalloregulator ArsR/SmtB family transcription factor [Pirellulales bacterium]|nr:metalloregulator ArsR/SmtB family transcription factor [Pirellulales bacterium]